VCGEGAELGQRRLQFGGNSVRSAGDEVVVARERVAVLHGFLPRNKLVARDAVHEQGFVVALPPNGSTSHRPESTAAATAAGPAAGHVAGQHGASHLLHTPSDISGIAVHARERPDPSRHQGWQHTVGWDRISEDCRFRRLWMAHERWTCISHKGKNFCGYTVLDGAGAFLWHTRSRLFERAQMHFGFPPVSSFLVTPCSVMLARISVCRCFLGGDGASARLRH